MKLNDSRLCAAGARVMIPVALLASAGIAIAKDKSAPQRPVAVSDKLVLVWRIPEDLLANTTGGRAVPQPPPPGIPTLTEGLTGTQAGLVRLRGENGKLVAIGSQLVMPQLDQSGLSGTIPYHVAYSIVMPGRGTLSAVCTEHSPEVFATLARRAREAGVAWVGDERFQTTVGPRKDGKCDLGDGTGEFAGRRGSLVKVHVLTRADLQGDFGGLVGETIYTIEFERGRKKR